MWLLLDLPALIGIALSFGPLMIMAISSGRRAMFGKKISSRIQDCIMHMLPIAETRLHYALCRLAWRTLGWNVGEVRLEPLSPTTSWSDIAARLGMPLLTCPLPRAPIRSTTRRHETDDLQNPHR